MLAVRKFLGQDYRGMQTLLNEWSDLRQAIGLAKVPDYSTLCLAEAKLAREGAFRRPALRLLRPGGRSRST